MQFLGFKLSDLSAVVSIIGTVGTTTIAMFALSSWKKQLKVVDRRKLSHSMSDVLGRFVQLNRQFILKCESWVYKEELEIERSRLQAEIGELIDDLGDHLEKFHLLSVIGEKQMEEYKNDLRNMSIIIGNIRTGIVSFHYLDDENKTPEVRLKMVQDACRPHYVAINAFKTKCRGLIKKSFQ
ncbi:hypothetical protein [Vibrio alginolyticus]|uniref:hypothetical protein n=1 Tax=Vibrio alginolyticus TaxID=663 RepID=UPI002119DA02|nr:hypothetical protein [Vibrio alginolyticus]MCQ9090573.1 hypothetical protein [Vibrio alginolyticus]